MVLENVSKGFLRELLRFSVTSLLQRVLPVCGPGLKLPAFFPGPRKLQKYIESVIRT